MWCAYRKWRYRKSLHATFASYVLYSDTANDTNNTKLYGIESGATADQTDARILAAIKRVDEHV